MAMDSKECLFLPSELVEKILCRVPTKSLVRFKVTCKRWLALFQDKRFIYEHLALLDEQIIRTRGNMVKIIDPVIGVYSSLSIPHELQFKPQIYTMIHCNGLLLCILESGSMAVWNPCLKQVRWIKSMVSYSACCCFGFGYDDLSRDGYKILRFVNGIFAKNTGSYNVDIYDFNSDSWKTFNVSLDWHVLSRCKGVSLKGIMYWIAKWNNEPGIHIQSFNFSSDTFKPLCSIPFVYVASDVVDLSAFRGDSISLLHKSEETAKVEIWITNKVMNGVTISWTKFFSVRLDLPVLSYCESLAPPMHFIAKKKRIVVCCEEVLADEINVAVNVYVILEGEIKRKVEIERHQLGFSWPFVSGYVYFPSLVPVPAMEDHQD